MTASDPFNLERFVNAQQGVFEIALNELQQGRKQSHWIWFIFPQFAGLGHSSTTRYYSIASLSESSAYMDHPLLGTRLRRCVEALQPWAGKRGADEIFGVVDAMKLKSCLTLFDHVERQALFDRTLLNFFGGKRDERTLALLKEQQ